VAAGQGGGHADGQRSCKQRTRFCIHVLWRPGLIETEMDYPVKSDDQKRELSSLALLVSNTFIFDSESTPWSCFYCFTFTEGEGTGNSAPDMEITMPGSDLSPGEAISRPTWSMRFPESVTVSPFMVAWVVMSFG
jgi:hypothetical protein